MRQPHNLPGAKRDLPSQVAVSESAIGQQKPLLASRRDDCAQPHIHHQRVRDVMVPMRRRHRVDHAVIGADRRGHYA